jgi:hypothetical protein
MTIFTIVTTNATQGSEAVEVSTLADDFANEDELLGYSRRMAEEMLGLAEQLSLDFDYSSIGLYEGDLVDEDLDPAHSTFMGAWVLDEEGAAYVPAEEFRQGMADRELS